MNKRIIAFSVAVGICFSCFMIRSRAVFVSARGAVMMCVETGEVLFSENPDKRLSMASTTKIMTSLLALEAAKPQLEIEVTSEMAEVEGTSMGLRAGDSVSLLEIVYGMLIQSGNDAANTAAIVLAGSVEDFSVMMNKRAEEIGMKNTNFVTPSGLDDEEHYSTAYDMALLACECIKNPEFRKICSQKSARLSYGNPPYDRTLTNHNRLLWSMEDCIGIKTGFTQKSGRCLVSAAQRDGVTLVVVTLNDPDDWNDHISLFDYGFSVCSSDVLSPACRRLNVCGSDKDSVPVVPAYEPLFPKAENVKCEVYLRRFEYAPVLKGETVGKAVYRSGGKIVYELPLIAGETAGIAVHIAEEKQSASDRIIGRIKEFRLFRR